MVYYKLEEAILEALKGKEFGNNKIIVETSYNGYVKITEYEEVEDLSSEVEELEEKIDELNEEIENLEDEISELKEKLEEGEY